MATDQSSQSSSQFRIDPNEWVDEYGDYLYRYAYSRLRDPNAAEEAVQETFLAGIRYYEQFSGKGSEQAWLLGILKRKIVDYVRRRNKHSQTTPYEDRSRRFGQDQSPMEYAGPRRGRLHLDRRKRYAAAWE